MTRKEIELIAEVMLNTKPAVKSGLDMLEQWKWTVECVAAQLSTINPNFDRDSFRKACGL